MWLLRIKNISKDEVLKHFFMAAQYKQINDDVHCQYYTKSDLLSDLHSAQKHANRIFDTDMLNLYKYNYLLNLYNLID